MIQLSSLGLEWSYQSRQPFYRCNVLGSSGLCWESQNTQTLATRMPLLRLTQVKGVLVNKHYLSVQIQSTSWTGEDTPFTWWNPKKLPTVCDIICSLLSSCGNLNWYQLIIHPGRHFGSHLRLKTLMFNYFSNSNTLLPLTKTLHGKIHNT